MVWFYYVYVLCTGASVMALELAASRFLAPYFGTSMVVWANIIGLILLALSIGYVLGGRIADKHPKKQLLMSISLVSGIWTATLPLWGHLIFKNLSAGILDTPVMMIALSLIGILLVFAPPVLLLAMVSPFVIRLTTTSNTESGKVAGNLYAFSTVGSLVGTFGTAFGTIPYFGVVQTLLFWSLVLVLVSAIGLWPRVQVASFGTALWLVLCASDIFAQGTPKSPYGDVLWRKDTLYQYVQVVQQHDGAKALVYNEGGGVQSVERPNDALSSDDYYDDYLLLPLLQNQPQNVAVLGSAGGTIVHLLSKYDKPILSELQMTGVEIDPQIIPLDYRYFGVQPSDAHLVNEDARVFIQHTSKRFDLVIVDAYMNQIYIPPHLSTQQFFSEVRSKLTPSGMLALNVNATNPNSRLLASFEKTLNQVFPYTYRVKARGAFNYLLIGSNQMLSTSNLDKLPVNNPLDTVAREWPVVMHPLQRGAYRNGLLLTDNHAPIELLTDSMIYNYAKNGQS